MPEVCSWPQAVIATAVWTDAVAPWAATFTKKDWFQRDQSELTFEEWSSHINSDRSMHLDGIARTTTPGGDVIGIVSPGLAVWTAYSGHDEDRIAWFDLSKREISARWKMTYDRP